MGGGRYRSGSWEDSSKEKITEGLKLDKDNSNLFKCVFGVWFCRKQPQLAIFSTIKIASSVGGSIGMLSEIVQRLLNINIR
jgi:hypothetical protein